MFAPRVRGGKTRLRPLRVTTDALANGYLRRH
jgi:hypothetical protein